MILSFTNTERVCNITVFTHRFYHVKTLSDTTVYCGFLVYIDTKQTERLDASQVFPGAKFPGMYILEQY